MIKQRSGHSIRDMFLLILSIYLTVKISLCPIEKTTSLNHLGSLLTLSRQEPIRLAECFVIHLLVGLSSSLRASWFLSLEWLFY